MKDAPPEQILIFSDLHWIKTTDFIEGAYVKEMIDTPKDRRVWHRVFGAGLEISVPDYACKPGKDGLPVSVASPRRSGGELDKVGDHTVRVFDDGTMTNAKGQPIIDSNAAAKRNADRTGMELD